MYVRGSPRVTLVQSARLFEFGNLSGTLATHHLCRSRADSKGALAQDLHRTQCSVEQNAKAAFVYVSTAFAHNCISPPFDVCRNEAYSRELATHWMCFVFWNVHPSISTPGWKYKITQCSKRTIEAWVAWISIYRNMQMYSNLISSFLKAFKWCQNVLKLVYSVSEVSEVKPSVPS